MTPKAENLQYHVTKFRDAFALPVSDYPRALTPEEAALHIQMIRDEFEQELVPALLSGDVVETYDAAIDVLYYLIGMLTHAGMDLYPGFLEVQESNLSKLDPETGKAIYAREGDGSGEPAGKVLKGKAYFKPDLRSILVTLGWDGHADGEVLDA